MHCSKKRLLLLLFAWSIFIQLQAQIQFQFKLVWEQDIFPNNPYRIQFDVLERPYFYVANDNGGIRIFKNETASTPIQVDQIFPSNWAFMKVMDVTQQGDYLYLALGSIFDLFVQNFGIAIINVANPEAAFVTDYWQKAVPQEGSAIIKVKGDYAFLGAMGEGLYILNISDPTQIEELTNYVPDINFPVPNPNFIQEPNARGMALKDDLVYLCYDAGGIRVIDVESIAAPNEINRYINVDFIDQTPQAYNNIIIHENLAYIATDFCGLEIIDIEDPMDIKQVGIWNPWRCDSIANFWQNSPGHTNQLRFLPNHEGEILIVNGNDTDLIALDVREPSSPIVLDTFGMPGDSLRTWGIGMSEHQIAAAYYTSNAPWISKESKLKLFEWDLTTNTASVESLAYRVFPNPSHGNISVSLNEKLNGLISVRVVDLLGSSVFDQKIKLLEGSFQLNLTNLELVGIYFLQAKIGERHFVAKLVLN